MRGPRVLGGDGAVIVPWNETLCYGASKHGYHGGVTPQEVLTPVLVFARGGAAPDGWLPSELAPPAWWTGEQRLRASVAAPVAAAPKRRTKKTVDADAPTLFAPAVDWVAFALFFPRQLQELCCLHPSWRSPRHAIAAV